MDKEKRDLRQTWSANKNLRVSAVKTCPLDPADLLARSHVAAAHQGFRAETIETVGHWPRNRTHHERGQGLRNPERRREKIRTSCVEQ